VTNGTKLTIIRLHCNTSEMQPTAADGVAWSVCLSVGLSVTTECRKNV